MKLGKLVVVVGAVDDATMELGNIEITLEGNVTASVEDAEDDAGVTDAAVDDMADGAEVAVMTRPPAEGRGDGEDKEIGVNELFPPEKPPFRSCNTFTVAQPAEEPDVAPTATAGWGDMLKDGAWDGGPEGVNLRRGADDAISGAEIG